MALYKARVRSFDKSTRWRQRGLFVALVATATWVAAIRYATRATVAASVQPDEAETIVARDGETIVKIAGKVKVIDAHTMRFADGSEVELNGGMDAPDLEQQAAIGDAMYPWGEQAAEFLQDLIGDRVVTCYVAGRRGPRFRGACFVEETMLEIEMVRNGWAVSNHSGLDGWQMIAREHDRGIWRGQFVTPAAWRKGDRLPRESGESQVQRKALDALKRFEPMVTFDADKPGKPVIAIQFRANTVEKVSSDDLAYLASFTNLRSLDVPSASLVTDEGLQHLAALDKLVELNVNWTKVTAAGVVGLVKGRLMMSRLEIAGVPFSDEDLAAMRGIPDLRELSLRKTLVTDLGVAQLKRFEQLRSLSLMSTLVGDAGLEHLAALTALEDLDLDRTAITDGGLAHLKGLRNLRRLQMARTAVTDAGLESLRELSQLKSLNVRGTRVTGEGLKKLKQQLPRLEIGPES